MEVPSDLSIFKLLQKKCIKMYLRYIERTTGLLNRTQIIMIVMIHADQILINHNNLRYLRSIFFNNYQTLSLK